MKSKLLKSGVCLFVFTMVMMFSSLAAAAPIKVELTVVDIGGVDVLQVLDNEMPCSGVATDPCIDVALNTKPFIIFNLPNACDGAGGPDYKLSNIRISMINKVWPTPDDPLNKKVANDFKADPNTGIIQFPAFGKNKKTSMKLKFKNRNRYAYSVFYEVAAEICDPSSDADDITLDPEIRNRGSN